MATIDEIRVVKDMIQTAIASLRDNDSDLVELPDDSNVLEYENGQQQVERKLHEVCINHRMALYIEYYVKQHINADYKVDIEYNRYYKNKKVVSIDGAIKSVRPDIIVHSRANRDVVPQHYLIIEAKKDTATADDEKKVKSFISDAKYAYMFGLTVAYKNLNDCKARLFYKNDDEIVCEDLRF